LVLESLERHLHGIARLAIRKSKTAHTVGYFTAGNRELSLSHANDYFVRSALFDKQHSVFTGLKCRHTRNVKFEIADFSAKGRYRNTAPVLAFDVFINVNRVIREDQFMIGAPVGARTTYLADDNRAGLLDKILQAKPFNRCSAGPRGNEKDEAEGKWDGNSFPGHKTYFGDGDYSTVPQN
jgi:hypothetical protein